jgi:putative multiple sugar transport system permease protein
MEKILHTFKSHMRQYAMIIALVAIMILFQVTTGGILLKPLNVTNLVLQNSYILVLAIGMLLCILAGGNIDLSVGSVAAFVGAVSATFIVTFHMPVFPALILSLIIGALAGAWQGYWIAYVRIPAFIVTLSGMLVFRGFTMITLKGQTLAPFPVSYQKIASGFIPDVLRGGGEGLHITTLVIGVVCAIVYLISVLRDRRSKQKYDFVVSSIPVFALKVGLMMVVINTFTYWLARYRGIPNVLVLLTVLVMAYTFMTNKTIVGRHIYAFGGNEKAAKLSGVKTNRVLFGVYVNMSVLAALAGIIFAGRLNAATPKAGTLFELDAIASCFIGGASATGGVGTIIGAIIGGLIMGVLNNGMSIMGISIDWQQSIKGLVLLFAVAFDVYSKSKSK